LAEPQLVLDAGAIRARKGGRRLAMLTAYDYPTALALDGCGLDLILVGDSLGEVELGYDSTRAVTLEMLAHHVRAVRHVVATVLPLGVWHVLRHAPHAGRYAGAPGEVSVRRACRWHAPRCAASWS
jgi:3-methyl-2-oxobutanoate hydroxymethyltransferase